MNRPPIWLLIITASLALGCEKAHRPGFVSGDAGGSDAPPGEPAAVDLLFVLDNSRTMAEKQELLLQTFPAFIEALDQAAGERPSLHLGVVTTDTGVPTTEAIPDCTQTGDDGLLQSTPGQMGCTPPDGAFIRDVPIEGGGRDINYPEGALVETFSCIAQVGIEGCGFEMPLEAMRRALDGRHLANAGFLRDGALLAVIFVTDEDDCSADNAEMFGEPAATVDDPLGPLSSFRCFDFGVVCDIEDRSFGPRADCAPAEPGQYHVEVSDYVDFITSLRRPERFVTAALAGPPTPVAVRAREVDGNPELTPSCEDAVLGTAVPAVRLGGFIDAFAGRGRLDPICAGTDPALAAIAQLIAGNLP